jgi:hypothetical protein
MGLPKIETSSFFIVRERALRRDRALFGGKCRLLPPGDLQKQKKHVFYDRIMCPGILEPFPGARRSS